MEHQLNNPLRPSIKSLRTEPATEKAPAPTKSDKTVKVSDPITPPESAPMVAVASQTSAPLSQTAPASNALLKPEVRKALDNLNASEELRNLMLQLAHNGIEIAGPKKIYVKHSYEIAKDLHQRFHEMYPVLGFKKVKDAINDAIESWCDQNEAEFRRRSGGKK